MCISREKKYWNPFVTVKSENIVNNGIIITYILYTNTVLRHIAITTDTV